MVTISVIVTVYNSEDSIQQVIKSIKDQTGVGSEFNLEVIVVDDCSTDNSYNLLKDLDVNLYQNETNSGGPNKGRNLGMEVAKGSFICFCDHDDIWGKEKILKMLELSKLAPIISSGYTVNDLVNSRKFERVNSSSEKRYVEYPKNISFLSKLTKSNKGQNLYLGSIMIHKDLAKIKFEEEHGMADFDWILKILHNNSSVEVCESLYKRNIKKTNLSLDRRYRKNDFDITCRSIKSFYKDYPTEVSIGLKKTHGTYARYFYLINDMKMARLHFLKSQINLKTILYFITTFVGSRIVKKIFNVFG